MYSSKSKKYRASGIARLLLFTILILSLAVPRAHASSVVLEQAKQLVRSYYVNGVPDSVVDSAASVDELVEALGDPYSDYFTAEEYEEFTNSINNKFYGIGVHIDMVPEGVLVVSVIDNSPAYNAGLKDGDIILSADGHLLSGLSSEEAVSYIKGADGTTVHIVVDRGGASLGFDIVRREISEPTVSGTMQGSLAYIDIATFGQDTPDEFAGRLKELDKNNPSGYIVDLRNNLGGYLDAAIDLAGHFLPGKPALLTRDKSGDQDTLYAPTTYGEISKPVFFLINEYSASASEVLTAAVKDNDKAFIIGTNSYGKGTVQSLFKLSDGSVLKLTVYRFFSPSGNAINKVGIAPDLDTGSVDPSRVAELLGGDSSNKSDKTGYMRVGISDRIFEIDLNKASLPEYREAYGAIVNKAMEERDVYIGAEDGWVRLYGASEDMLWRYCFYSYRETPELKGVAADKKFSISFSSDVSSAYIEAGDIQLIDASDGTEIGLDFQNTDGRTLRVIPEESLRPGGGYLLIIKEGMEGSGGEYLKQGVFTYITVMQ